MSKMIFALCLVLFILTASVCEASSVSRTISKTTADMGENITVNLTVSITSGEDFYAIDETYPSGWTVVSTAVDTNQSGHIKWIVIQGAVNTVHSYVVRTPAVEGSYTFSGLYMFENMTNENSISGQNQVTVASSDTTPPNITFVNPTPPNNTLVQINYIYVNVLLSEDPGTCLLNWHNGTWTNLTMTLSGFKCHRNMTNLQNGTYQFRVYATDTSGNLNISSGARQNQLAYSPAGPSCPDGTCNGAESCSSCPQDCDQCPCPSGQTRCSDGVCRTDCGGGSGGGGSGGAPSCINNQTRNCSISYKGYCASGNETCVDGGWKGCPQPLMELCNRMDDDCDGAADEGLKCECYDGDKRPCGLDIGECRSGTQLCVNSHWNSLCYGEKKPIAEVCNGADDDCDGQTDEECREQLSFKPCPDGAIPETGCICEQTIYASGYCYSNKYYEGFVIRDWTMPIIGTAFVLIFAVIFIRWRHRHLKAQFKP